MFWFVFVSFCLFVFNVPDQKTCQLDKPVSALDLEESIQGRAKKVIVSAERIGRITVPHPYGCMKLNTAVMEVRTPRPRKYAGVSKEGRR